jgi:demethylspheroidene O-methyltransferase
MPGWRAAWIAWRNRRLSDARFQRWAADFPLTAPVARARTDALFDLTSGFVYAQVLAACVRLDLFARVRAAPRAEAQLAAETGLPENSVKALIEAAVSLGLLERVGAAVALGPHGAALLGAPGLIDMIRHHESFYADLADPVALLGRGRGERLPEFWPYAGAAARGDVAPYSALMTATQPAVAADILSAYSMARHRVLMDVGGGEGAFLAAAAARWPHLELRLFDLPAVAARAGARGVAACFGGDFLRDALPSGADLVTLIRVLHDQDDAGAARLLSSAYDALAPRGRLLIAEPMTGRGRLGGAYLAMYLLAMGRGRPRSPGEIARLARAAGFGNVRMLHVRTPALLRVMVAGRD